MAPPILACAYGFISTMSLFFHSALTANTWLPDISRLQLSEHTFLYDCVKPLYLSQVIPCKAVGWHYLKVQII